MGGMDRVIWVLSSMMNTLRKKRTREEKEKRRKGREEMDFIAVGKIE